MPALPRDRLDAYGEGIDALARAASEAAMAAYDEMRRRDVSASVAEVRESAIGIVEAASERYGSASGELAARLYDEMAAAAGASVEPASIPDEDEAAPESTDRQIRYAVGALVDEREDI